MILEGAAVLFLLQGIMQTQGNEPGSPLQADSSQSEPPQEAPRPSLSPLLIQFKQLLFHIYLRLGSLSPESPNLSPIPMHAVTMLEDRVHFLQS